MMYYNGEGTVKDLDKAYEWFNKASLSLYDGAYEMMEKCRKPQKKKWKFW